MRKSATLCAYLLALTASLGLSGCAFNSQPVAAFGKSTATLTETYRPLLMRPASLCEEDALLKDVLTEPTFDAMARANKPDDLMMACKALRTEQQARVVVVNAVSAYGQQLALLAGADPGALTADIEAVAAKAKTLKDKGGTPTLNGDRIDALSKLVTIVVSMVRGQQAQALTREVIAEAQAPLEVLVAEMKVWAEGTVAPRLKKAAERHRIALNSALVPASDTSLVPGAKDRPALVYVTRLSQLDMLQKINALEAEQKNAEAFGAAATSLIEAHRGLGAAVNKVSTSAQIQALQAFVDQVRGLRDAAEAL